MIVLAEPDPTDMVQAIKKAISILPIIDPQEMHNRVSAFFKIYFSFYEYTLIKKSFYEYIYLDNSIITTGEGGFEPQISSVETSGGANQLSYKAHGFINI